MVGHIERFDETLYRRAAETDAFGDPQIELPEARSAPGISRQVAGARAWVDEARPVDHVRRADARARRQIGPIGEARIPVVIAACRDVEGHGGSRRQHAADLNLQRQRSVSADHRTMALIEVAVAVRIIDVEIVLLRQRVFGLGGRLVARQRVRHLHPG